MLSRRIQGSEIINSNLSCSVEFYSICNTDFHSISPSCLISRLFLCFSKNVRRSTVTTTTTATVVELVERLVIINIILFLCALFSLSLRDSFARQFRKICVSHNLKIEYSHHFSKTNESSKQFNPQLKVVSQSATTYRMSHTFYGRSTSY